MERRNGMGIRDKERERRQELDAIARDKIWLDEVINGALAAGITPAEWIARHLSESKFSNGTAYRPEDVSAHFLAKAQQPAHRAAGGGGAGMTRLEQRYRKQHVGERVRRREPARAVRRRHGRPGARGCWLRREEVPA
jgi:hypothetical protein